jgi:diaminopimelate decarboxylase
VTSAFAYRAGSLCVEDLPLADIAAEVGTPFYCYSTAQIRDNYRDFLMAFAGLDAHIYYAVKANPNQAVIRTLASFGAGAEVNSVGELERALHAGVKPDKIVFSGVGKRRDEIIAGLLARIHQFTVESIPELHAISQAAQELSVFAPIALRINPDIDARTHEKIATGNQETKFGIEIPQLDEAMKLATSLPNLTFKGFMVHVGSHMNDFEPFREAYMLMTELVREWRGKGAPVVRFDCGGGVGIAYDNEKLSVFSEYAKIVKEIAGNLGCHILFEPGRRLVGDAGVLVSRVTHVKQGTKRRFAVLDAGMNDLVRPAMYDARHTILPLREVLKKDASEKLDVVGPVCETSDKFGDDYNLPGIVQDDLVAIMQAGAYGASMSSNYNSRPLISEILVNGKHYAIVRRRIAVAEQIAWESLPPWLPA